MCSGSSKACLRALPDSQQIRSMISACRSSTRSCSLSSTALRSASEVRAQARCARRARANASATSSGLLCGTMPSGCPLTGAYVGSARPVVDSTPSVSDRT